MKSRICYQLTDATGTPFDECQPSCVSLPPYSLVAEFCDAVYAKHNVRLAGLDAAHLTVYSSLDDIIHGNKLNSLSVVSCPAENHLFVVVPLSQSKVSKDWLLGKKKRIQSLKHLLFYTSFQINDKAILYALTAYQKRKLATFAHGPHASYKVGDDVVIYSIIDKAPFDVSVIVVDKKRDFILLQSKVDICNVEFSRSFPFEGEEYLQIGALATSQEASPFSVSRGVVTSLELDANDHFLGSAGSNPGDSGGGCFSAHTNTLYGINVGCDPPISGDTTLTQMMSRFPARAHIVPTTFFV